ncbi:hypothetical protein MSSAC_4137 [Methanosarcina siciliae C2J]|uniref:Uncharacterized protein n=3 Tax=Methanosarcina siciliae TaxID=38027 RepID=A0A0E3PIH8_9EURY|nr:hypothetical protein [Methanosarcina siciliae]AKB30448.1 hypothetical protein MSSIT_3729 [Methanosarcina siciliae T4/M]AKB34363.1 hypothetical protein MSSIH_3673 [Methanosarcina siciliae HI350]AKB38727.1 hypothetical protein MSSAC_4137 [Methanosarcina siciliae C2J]
MHTIDWDNRLIKNMEKSAEELGIASCVKFTEPVTREDNSLWISTADLLVLTCLLKTKAEGKRLYNKE